MLISMIDDDTEKKAVTQQLPSCASDPVSLCSPSNKNVNGMGETCNICEH